MFIYKVTSFTYLAISGRVLLMHFSVFFIREEFCRRKNGRTSRRTLNFWIIKKKDSIFKIKSKKCTFYVKKPTIQNDKDPMLSEVMAHKPLWISILSNLPVYTFMIRSMEQQHPSIYCLYTLVPIGIGKGAGAYLQRTFQAKGRVQPEQVTSLSQGATTAILF